MPHYYITNMDEAKKNMLEYNRRSSRLYLETLLDGSNGILWDTFQMAMRLADTGNVSPA